MSALMTAVEPAEAVEAFFPAAPMTLDEAGLASSTVEQLILKDLYFRGDLSGRDIAAGVGFQFSVVEPLLENFKRQHLIDVKRSLGLGSISAYFTLSEAGRKVTQEALTVNQYTGRAPVPLEQYERAVRAQRLTRGWVTPENLQVAFKHMVLSPGILNQIGPAVNSGKSFLIYGQPGNGKTYLAEGLFKIESTPVYVPYAIECQGRIIQVFDPVYHRPVEDEHEHESVLTAFSGTPSSDSRWIKCHRPFIVTGGELTIEMLDLSLNPNSNVYDAPLQMKANNGIYLIDDFGRQRVSPTEVLNRWIVPLERRMDYLNLQTGGKITVPFEVFLVFSTNMQPEKLGDEAFLRRIQYKMYMRNPRAAEYVDIFERECQGNGLHCPIERIEHVIHEHYVRTGRPFRRCHPRDVIAKAIDLISFEGLVPELTTEVLNRSFAANFVSSVNDEAEEAAAALCA